MFGKSPQGYLLVHKAPAHEGKPAPPLASPTLRARLAPGPTRAEDRFHSGRVPQPRVTRSEYLARSCKEETLPRMRFVCTRTHRRVENSRSLCFSHWHGCSDMQVRQRSDGPTRRKLAPRAPRSDDETLLDGPRAPVHRAPLRTTCDRIGSVTRMFRPATLHSPGTQ